MSSVIAAILWYAIMLAMAGLLLWSCSAAW